MEVPYIMWDGMVVAPQVLVHGTLIYVGGEGGWGRRGGYTTPTVGATLLMWDTNPSSEWYLSYGGGILHPNGWYLFVIGMAPHVLMDGAFVHLRGIPYDLVRGTSVMHLH